MEKQEEVEEVEETEEERLKTIYLNALLSELPFSAVVDIVRSKVIEGGEASFASLTEEQKTLLKEKLYSKYAIE